LLASEHRKEGAGLLKSLQWRFVFLVAFVAETTSGPHLRLARGCIH
jgi:hypothetical protein